MGSGLRVGISEREMRSESEKRRKAPAMGGFGDGDEPAHPLPFNVLVL